MENSNLTPEQQKLVRTPEFKAWFGDWENSPETASKVVDENGEPLVVYHGTKYNFFIFGVRKKYRNIHKDSQYEPLYPIKLHFFTSVYSSAVYYLRESRAKTANVKTCFLNMRKMSEFDGRVFERQVTEENSDGIHADTLYAIIKPENIKLADGSNTTFDGSNPDIRFSDGGSLNSFQQLAKRYNGK